ncbi:hypothetical protein DdX_12405 [Ditylenchus destructor]|uniref:Uncharacterized protein n=1 Tax=Ditylenchus destructor TaxID=166010 RepID=A0AAD4MXW9_9BILA|nr:hypothetical protein DdX_12405 [Ditylenchus destructor]
MHQGFLIPAPHKMISKSGQETTTVKPHRHPHHYIQRHNKLHNLKQSQHPSSSTPPYNSVYYDDYSPTIYPEGDLHRHPLASTSSSLGDHQHPHSTTYRVLSAAAAAAAVTASTSTDSGEAKASSLRGLVATGGGQRRSSYIEGNDGIVQMGNLEDLIKWV